MFFGAPPLTGDHVLAGSALPPHRLQRRYVLATGALSAHESLSGVSLSLVDACRTARQSGVRISLRISNRQMQAGTLPAQVAAALRCTGLAPGRLELEVAASMLADCSIGTLLSLSALRDAGAGLMLGGFGIGRTCLSMLRRFPLTGMKLARVLTRGFPVDRDDAAVLRAMIELGRALQVSVVAEGIETEEQRAYLSGMGCDEGKGGLFGPDAACGAGRSAPASGHDDFPHSRLPASRFPPSQFH